MRYFVNNPSIGIASILMYLFGVVFTIFLACHSLFEKEVLFLSFFVLMTFLELWCFLKLGVIGFILTTVEITDEGVRYTSPGKMYFFKWEDIKSISVSGYFRGLSREPWICFSKEDYLYPSLNGMQSNKNNIMIFYRKKIIKQIKGRWETEIPVLYPWLDKDKVNS